MFFSPFLLFIIKILNWLGRPIYLFLRFALVTFQKVGSLILLPLFSFLPKIPFPKVSFRRSWLSLFLGVTLALITFWGFYLNILKDLPSPQKLIDRPLALTTKIYDRKGNLLYKIYHEENRTLIPLNEIPDFVIEATIAVEDREFYNHSGLSWRGIARAVKHNLTNPQKAPVGGSTITQQLVKNALLDFEKSWRRKIKEAILAILAEQRFSKDEILQMYFNEVSYGGTAYGIEEAAQKYFAKSVRNVNLAEGALLAGLPAGPTRFSPFGAYPTLAKERQGRVLSAMVETGYLTESEAENATQEPLRLSLSNDSLKAPHFVFYVKDLLVEKWGEQTLEEGGLEVVTSLDLDLQRQVEQIIKEELGHIAHLGVGNGAALIIRPKTGEILAMAGSKDYFDFTNDGNVNVTLSSRQPGSAIKVINYAKALQSGFTPATIIPDTAITFHLPYQEPYSPQNYDGQYHGNVSLRTALASSFNIPAVKVLAALGVEEMIKQGELMGITTWADRSRFGLSLTLGGGEVKMIDLAQAYSVLANLGNKVELTPFLTVKPSVGEKKLYELKNQGQKELVLDSGVAFLLNDILSDNYARARAFSLNSLLNIPNQKVAVKTGTSNGLRDNWAIGYTPEFLVAVWVGNNDNTPMSRIASGITGATPIWRRITDLMLEAYPNTGWETPENIVKIPICRSTGTLACEGCPQVGEEYFLQGTAPQEHCSSSWFLAKEEDQSAETKNQ
ncbi:transglycosylase domain-containing protein [Candidatus Shapirobacteria bacterium]|nr:transglycosylase domain-containing protein [Candidatus Shapirobacteria bacterium]